MIQTLRTLGAGFMAVLLLGAVGCCHYPGPAKAWPVAINADPSLANKAVEVDLVAVNQSELPTWQTMSVTDYFAAHNAMREGAPKHVMHFGPGQPTTQKFDASSPDYNALYKQWLSSGATTMIILANLPGDSSDLKGEQDPRRRMLPLGKCAWKKVPNDTWQLTLRASNLTVDTPPVPPPSK